MDKAKTSDEKFKVETEVWSRVSGYFQNSARFNRGKREEFRQRKHLKFNIEPEKLNLPGV